MKKIVFIAIIFFFVISIDAQTIEAFIDSSQASNYYFMKNLVAQEQDTLNIAPTIVGPQNYKQNEGSWWAGFIFKLLVDVPALEKKQELRDVRKIDILELQREIKKAP